MTSHENKELVYGSRDDVNGYFPLSNVRLLNRAA